MARHTELTQMLQSAAPALGRPMPPVAHQTARSPASPGLFTRMTGLWTSWILRRQLYQAEIRLAEVSDHLLDDAGLCDPTKPVAMADQDPILPTYIGRS